MSNEITRRNVLKLAAGAAGAAASSHWVFRLASDGRIVKAATADGEAFVPTVLRKKELDQLAAVCEAIIPQTNTPGARAARVHEYIDVALSIESEGSQKLFREGLDWLDTHCKKTTGNNLLKASPEDMIKALTPLSDANDTIADDLKPGATFFSTVKSKTIFGYYTSREGWVEELGRPEHVGMEKWFGCAHGGAGH